MRLRAAAETTRPDRALVQFSIHSFQPNLQVQKLRSPTSPPATAPARALLVAAGARRLS